MTPRSANLPSARLVKEGGHAVSPPNRERWRQAVEPIRRGAITTASMAVHFFPLTAIILLLAFLVWIQAMASSP